MSGDYILISPNYSKRISFCFNRVEKDGRPRFIAQDVMHVKSKSENIICSFHILITSNVNLKFLTLKLYCSEHDIRFS